MTLFFKFYYDLWTWISSKLSGDPHYDRLIYDILTENGIEYIIYLKFTDDVMIFSFKYAWFPTSSKKLHFIQISLGI